MGDEKRPIFMDEKLQDEFACESEERWKSVKCEHK